MRTLSIVLVVSLLGCASSSSSTPTAEPPTSAAPPTSETPVTKASSTPKTNAEEIADGESVHAGRVSFTGMVTPVKDGFSVRGVVVDDKLRDLLKDAQDVLPSDPDWFLGASVKVTGTVVSHDDPPPVKDGIVSQGHEGAWLGMSDVERVELVAMPVVVEGTLSRSKGLFQVDKYLVTRSDLAWSLVGSGGGKDGDRVRLYGQPRTYRCDPRAQCLQGGSIPMFDIGRAQKL